MAPFPCAIPNGPCHASSAGACLFQLRSAVQVTASPNRLWPRCLLAGFAVACAVQGALAAAPPATPEGGGQQPNGGTTPQSDVAAASTAPDTPPVLQNWAIHGQSTFTEFYHPGFTSPYRGPQSLDPGSRGDETWDVTLYAGVRPWRGAEIWVNPEVDQGFGPSNTFGVAGYPSAEAYKLGSADPYVRVPRLFLRQTLDVGGEVQGVPPDLNQLGGVQTANRVVFTVGKFSSFDVFDTNKYAHDPRNDFLNWSLIDAGSFDQAGDAWGFSYGASVEWYQDWWTVRGGAFDLPTRPGYQYLDRHFGHQVQYVAEFEERHTILGQDGKLKLSGFFSRGLLGSFAQAVALGEATGTAPSVQNVLRYRGKGGVSLNLEQSITGDLGFFARAGDADGTSSITSFTDIDNTVSLGLSLAGNRWSRPDDTVAIGFASNGISRHYKNYLNAGGIGLLIGDGRLPDSGREGVLETFYSFAFVKGVNLTADYQFIDNPAYNRDRGPVSFLGARLHAQF